MTAPNTALAWRVLDHIDAHPEQWDQGTWATRSDCGTVGCFAGWVCLLSGDQPDYDGDDDEGADAHQVWVEGGATLADLPDRAAALLRIQPDGGKRSERGYRLFHGKNTRTDLGRLVAEIFGPRPGEHINCPHDPEGADGNPFAAMICSPMGDGPRLVGDEGGAVVLVDHGPVKPPYGMPEREAYDRAQGGES